MRKKRRGTDGDDFITGSSKAENFKAAKGDDTIFGGGGNDRLYGGQGIDVLVGGEGKDSFGFSRGTNYIKDFNLEEGDTLFQRRGFFIDVKTANVIDDDLFVTYSLTNRKGQTFDDNTLVLEGTGDRFLKSLLNWENNG